MSVKGKTAYQYQLYDPAICEDPRNDDDPRCSSPGVYKRQPDPYAPTSEFAYQKLPQMYRDTTAGGNVSYFFNRRSWVGATGYGTDIVGEAEISIFEWRRSGARLGVLPGCDAYVSAIVTSLALFGAVFAPRRAWAAWRAAEPSKAQAKQTLFHLHDDADYEALLDADVETLRAELGLPAAGIAVGPQKRHPRAPRS